MIVINADNYESYTIVESKVCQFSIFLPLNFV